jgi:hypothetical protein
MVLLAEVPELIPYVRAVPSASVETRVPVLLGKVSCDAVSVRLILVGVVSRGRHWWR